MGLFEWWQRHISKPAPAPTPAAPKPEPKPVTEQPKTITATTTKDKWQINKIYPDSKTNFQHWYMDMNNPTTDSHFKNWKNANLQKESDGSWSSDGSDNGKYQVRLESWSESGSKKYLNCEITVYANLLGDVGPEPGSYAWQVYRGGGHHSSNAQCDGFAYKGRIRKDKGVVICKEILHPSYTSNRGGLRKLTKDPKGNYIGTKLVVYNLPERNGKTPVRIEVYCDESGMSQSGVLDPSKQDWVLMASTIDDGGWASGDGGGCPPLDKHNTTGKRKGDEIGNTSGGTSVGNLSAYRSDSVKTKIKYFSVREIVIPT